MPGLLQQAVMDKSMMPLDVLFARLTPWFGWLFSPLAYVAWLLMMLAAALAWLQHWPRVSLQSCGRHALIPARRLPCTRCGTRCRNFPW